MIGSRLEKAGWRQGSILESQYVAEALSFSNTPHSENTILIVASQSCDIANNNITADPYIELSIARVIADLDGNLTHNKNARMLHTKIMVSTNNSDVYEELNIELKAFEKVHIPKEKFTQFSLDVDKTLEAKQLDSYIAWLAARYSRPALPSEFNSRISSSQSKLKKKAKSVNEHLSGIYVEIMPDAEISPDEIYKVNLLGLVSPSFNGDMEKIKSSITAYAEIFENAGMNVISMVEKEDSISVATIKRFKRFYYDDLSFKTDAPLPSETQTIL